jgi:hypothetical protein
MPAASLAETPMYRRGGAAAVLVLVLAGVVASCGGGESDASTALPSSGRAYRALCDAGRLAVAASCRDRAAARAHCAAARQLRAVGAEALRDQLDDAYTIIPDQRRPVAAICAERLPFVTPGPRLAFVGARGAAPDAPPTRRTPPRR